MMQNWDGLKNDLNIKNWKLQNLIRANRNDSRINLRVEQVEPWDESLNTNRIIISKKIRRVIKLLLNWMIYTRRNL